MRLFSMLFLFVLSNVVLAQGKAHLEGSVKGQGDNLVMIIQYGDNFRQTDTVNVAADGSYSMDINVPEPGAAYFFIEDMKLSKQLFLEPGINARFDAEVVKTNDKKESYRLIATYKGDDADCYDFLNKYDGTYLAIANNWSWERLPTVSFRDYRAAIESSVDSLKSEANKVKSLSFRRKMLKQIDGELTMQLSRYAYITPYKADADLENYILALDHNDPQKLNDAETYSRWYDNAHPRKPGESYFKRLKDVFDNQDVINAFAHDVIIQWLQQAPEDMDTLLADFKSVSTSDADKAEADSVYAHYSKMRKGMPAVDFTFSDKNGKQYSLKDFRGKALYIDVWATWCGPCCAEIPYMEKLTERWKGDKRISMISISFDSTSKPWLKKLAVDKPKWPQYICPENFKSTLCREYDIHGIPRFLLFDKDGNILSLNAPRPSDENIDKFLEENLK